MKRFTSATVLLLVVVLCVGCVVAEATEAVEATETTETTETNETNETTETTALGSDPPDAECPCFTVEDLDALYDQLITSQGVTNLSCMERDYSGSQRYPPYTYYYLAVCDSSSCDDLPHSIEAGVYSAHPQIGPGGARELEAWNAVCNVIEFEGEERAFHLYDANLTRGEVKACSILFKSSQWGQYCN